MINSTAKHVARTIESLQRSPNMFYLGARTTLPIRLLLHSFGDTSMSVAARGCVLCTAEYRVGSAWSLQLIIKILAGSGKFYLYLRDIRK